MYYFMLFNYCMFYSKNTDYFRKKTCLNLSQIFEKNLNLLAFFTALPKLTFIYKSSTVVKIVSFKLLKLIISRLLQKKKNFSHFKF